jgi:hypothetical protein
MHMNRIPSVAAVIALAFTATAAGAAPFGALDECLEVGIELSSLPGSVPGQLAVTPCADCAPVLLNLDQDTRFYVGEHAVSLALLRQYAQRAGRETRACHDKEGHVTRLIVTGTLDAADRNP